MDNSKLFFVEEKYSSQDNTGNLEKKSLFRPLHKVDLGLTT